MRVGFGCERDAGWEGRWLGEGGVGGRGSGRKARRQTFRPSEHLKRTLTFAKRLTSRSEEEGRWRGGGGSEGGAGRYAYVWGEGGVGVSGCRPKSRPPRQLFFSPISLVLVCFCPPSSPLRSPPLPPAHLPPSPAEPELSNLGGVRPASTHLADRRLGRCTASARHNQ